MLGEILIPFFAVLIVLIVVSCISASRAEAKRKKDPHAAPQPEDTMYDDATIERVMDDYCDTLHRARIMGQDSEQG